jgi:hypothetical protein
MATSYLSGALGSLAATPRLEPQRAPFRSQPSAAPFDTAPARQPTTGRFDPSRHYSVAEPPDAPPLMIYDDPPPADNVPPSDPPPLMIRDDPPPADDAPQTVDPATEPHLAAPRIMRRLPISASPFTRQADPVIDMPAVEAIIPAAVSQVSRKEHQVHEAAATSARPPRSHAPHPLPVPPASAQDIDPPPRSQYAAARPLTRPIPTPDPPLARPSPPSSAQTASSRTPPSASVQIGTIEITIDAPPPHAAPRRQSAAPSARLARGFASFGWTQS